MIIVFAIADVSAYNVADILHLHESDSGVDIVHGIFIADLLDVIFKPRTFLVKAEPTEPAGAVEFRFRLHGQESSVYCGQMLDGLQGKDGIWGIAAGHDIVIPGPQGMCGVLDERNSGLLINLFESIDVTYHSGIVYEYDGLGLRGYEAPDTLRVQKSVAGIYVSPHHFCPDHCNACVGRFCCHRG